MSVTSTDLMRVVTTIWSTQFGLVLDDPEAADFDSGWAEGETIVVRIRFIGAFSGTLEQRCSRSLSARAAAAAFASEGSEVDSGEIRDVVAELAHMTAGNLKTMLPGDSEVVYPGTIETQTSDEEPIATARFTLDGEPLLVTLSRQSSEA